MPDDLGGKVRRVGRRLGSAKAEVLEGDAGEAAEPEHSLVHRQESAPAKEGTVAT